ncbi:hypothetical protein ACFU5B_07755 [Streptomyces murinus]|uniref:hypothetical protein n=1 Tax=Streptomyces murinus TaxID=33900 RepID=UPI0036295F04
MEARTGSEGEKIKHLEFIQAVIARLGNNSFVIRGWSVTAGGALLALSVQAGKWQIAILAFFIGVGFWALDSSYLRRERMFRLLYGDVALFIPSRVPLFSMDTQAYQSAVGWRSVLVSSSVLMVHLPIVAVDLVTASALARY